MPDFTELKMVRTAGVISSIALVSLFLALKDISHNEVDVTLEWHVVEISLVILLVFHVLVLRLVRAKSRRIEETSSPT